MAAGNLTNAFIALAGWLAAAILFGTAMLWTTLKLTAAGKVAAARENDSRGGSGLREQRPGTQNKQTQRTNPFRTGDSGADR